MSASGLRVIRFVGAGLREWHELAFCVPLPCSTVRVIYSDREVICTAPELPQLQRLVRFCGLEMKSHMVKELICASSLMEAQPECVAGSCKKCGFRQLWSQGVRPKIVGSDGALLDGTSPIWAQEVRYEVLKSGGSTPSDGSNTEEKETLRAQRKGSLVDFLDEFERVSIKFPAHRHLVGDAKAKAKQREQKAWFIINSTELRAVNFSMVALDTPPAPTRSSGRRAGVVSAPPPKRYTLPKEIDNVNDIRCACW